MHACELYTCAEGWKGEGEIGAERKEESYQRTYIRGQGEEGDRGRAGGKGVAPPNAGSGPGIFMFLFLMLAQPAGQRNAFRAATPRPR